MFKIQEIREMIKLIDESTIEHLEIEEGESKISIQRKVTKLPETIKQAIPSVANTLDPAAVARTQESSKETLQVAATKESTEEVHAIPKNTGNENHSTIVSPMVGTFYRAPGTDADPFVKVGDKVDKSTVVCILEAMKLFNEIEAEMDGEIAEVLVENGQLVEYGQPLFLVKLTS
ncbi:acetyl-CoA carboxylase biotin carboxyl carrier protein [Neobacillus bataviensis]|uniref:acetyl-CoA carboxylase biotin carboxyl carrier protein n=1 Tax=Neobacillus bataviensis TaxID=220685 RepID=UPI001CBB38CC|nr:acetyl-CoA carboxylase biotin carboxyl carrier protein [Neobacillus bataviensis]